MREQGVYLESINLLHMVVLFLRIKPPIKQRE